MLSGPDIIVGYFEIWKNAILLGLIIYKICEGCSSCSIMKIILLRHK